VDSVTSKPSLEELLDEKLMGIATGMAKNLVVRYGRYNAQALITVDDLRDEALLAAATAYASYDPTRGAMFITYVYPYMRHAMHTYCKKFGHVLTISEKDSRDFMEEINGIGVLRIDQRVVNTDGEEFDIPVGSGAKCSLDVDDFFLRGFNTLEREIIKDHYLGEYSLREIAIRHRISKPRVGAMIRDLTDRMKERAGRYVEDN